MQTIPLPSGEPQRLDVALATALGSSRSKIQHAIKDGRVTVDGQQANAHMLVDETSKVQFVSETPRDAEPGKTAKLPLLSILYEDADVLVVDKPAGLLVHPTATSREATLFDALIAHTPAIATAGDSPIRGGIVHRLDKEASGVLIVAKHHDAFVFLKKQFSERLTKKIYTVLVLGSVRDDAGVISFPIARAVGGGRMAARPMSQEGREAITHFDVLERFPHCTLLSVEIKTGRTHQIRAHFFAREHPVVGDTLYVQRGAKQLKLDRLFLHASELTVTLPSGEEKIFTAPLPSSLANILNELRATHHKTL